MQHPQRPLWKSAVVLMAPVLLLLALGWGLQFTQPAQLRATEVRFKRLNSTPLAPAWVRVQILVFIEHERDAQPAWWGEPVSFGQRGFPFCTGSNGQQLRPATWSLNSCTFDAKRKQYRAAIYFTIKDAPQWTEEGTFHIDLHLHQERKTRGVLPLNTPVRL